MIKTTAIVAFFFVSATVAKAQQKILIAAASDLRFALDSLKRSFESTHHGTVDISYGSSGKLTEQIIQGAPFDIFFSADVAYPERLEKLRKTGSPIYPYAKGRIVLWSKRLDPNAKQVRAVLDPAIVKIAIANPTHAPYGRRAVEALEYYGFFESVKAKLVYGENISQTAQFVTSGAADIGFIALSLALSPAMQKDGGKYYVIPEESHQPLIQGAVITLHGKDSALANTFLNFIRTDAGISILKHFGFTRP